MRALLSGDLEPLVAQLRRRRCVLCVGGELTSDGSLRRLIGKLLALLPDSADARAMLEQRPLMAADLVRRQLGARFAPALRETTASAGIGEALRVLGALPFSAVVTTAYDHAVERAFARDGVDALVHTPSSAAPARGLAHARAVWKVLGDPDREETIVWGAADLQRALATEGYRVISRELFRTHSFLFVGFDWQDAELTVLLERVLSDAPTGGVDHYALLSNLTALEREQLYATYHIRALTFDSPSALAGAIAEALGDPRHAMPADDDPEGWLALLREDRTRQDVLAQLERLAERLRAAGDHEARVGLCVGRAEIDDDPLRRAAWLTEAARVLEEDIADPGRAFTALLAAYAEQPSEVLWSRLCDLGAATRQLHLLADEARQLATQLTPREGAAVWVRLARLLGEELARPADALAALDAALAIDPRNAAALALRITLFRATEQWPLLLDALAQSLPGASAAAQKCAIHTELGQLYEQRLGDPLAAAACFQVAIDSDPLNEAPQQALEALLIRRGDHEALVALLEHRLATSFGAARRALQTRVADLYADQLGDPAQAVVRYQELLLDAPGDASLLRRMALLWHRQPNGAPRAVEYLERLLVAAPRDEEIFATLERIYTEVRDWHSLLEVFRRHAAIAPPATRLQLWLEAGALCEDELKDPALALAAYLEVDRAEPDHPEALAALTRLYESTQDHARAIAIIERRAATASDARQRAELHHHAGELARDRDGDARAGKPHFTRAIGADPSYLPPTLELVELHRQEGEFLDAARRLLDAVPHATSVLQRTRFLVEAGELFEAVQDVDRAVGSYLQALEVDPAHVDAATRACVLLRRAGRDQELLPIAEMLSRREAPRAVRTDRLETFATAALAIGDLAKAQRAYESILVLNSSHLGGLRGRAEVLFRQEDWTTAAFALDQLAEHANVLGVPARVELHHQRGVCALRLKRDADAREQFERARLLDPTHRPSLLALLDLGAPDAAALIATKRGLTKTASADERRRLWTDIGDLYIDKIENPIEAVAAWTAGLEARPNDLPLLHRLMRLHVEQKAWAEALEILTRLIDNEKLPVVRAKYRYTAGMICLEHTGRFADAADHLWAAVEDDPTLERALVALETMLRNHKSWKELARYYRWALKQPSIADKRDRQLQLWTALGEVCLTRLDDTRAALLSFEVAVRLDPQNRQRHQQLAQLYALAGPAYLDKSIAARQLVLQADKGDVEAYQALCAVYAGNGQPRKAAACERAIAALRGGAAPVTAHASAPSFERPLSEEDWSRLRHPDEDPLLSAVFVLVAPVIVASMAQRARTPLQRKHLVAPGDERRFARALRRAARALAVPPPELDVAPEQAAPASFALHVDERLVVPVLTIGAPLLEAAASDDEVWFLAGQCVALLRPERLLRWLLPLPQHLAHLLEAAVALGKGATPTGELGKTIEGLRRELTPVALDQLAGFGHALGTSDKPIVERVRTWLAASDHTATRAGFVLSGDLAICKDAIARAQRPDQVAGQPQRILDLVWSSVTEEIFAVQDQLAATR